MKEFIKKSAAVAFSAVEILFAVPSAFCSTNKEPSDYSSMGKSCKKNERGHLDRFNIMVASKYFERPEDLANLSMVNKKYKEVHEMFKYSPVKPFDRKVTPNVVTRYVECDKGDEPLVFPEAEGRNEELSSDLLACPFEVVDKEIEKIVYLPGSFTWEDANKVLRLNFASKGEKWSFEVEFAKENDAFSGVNYVCTSPSSKQIVFQFRPKRPEVTITSEGKKRVDYGNFSDMTKYNSFLKRFGITDSKFWVLPFRKF